MNIARRAATALDYARADSAATTDPDTVAPPARRTRARIARHITAMLGVDPAHVQVTADPLRHLGVTPGHLITVHDPADPPGPPAAVLRLIPQTGDEVLFCLLGPCPDCGGEVPLAAIADLADLGLHLERWAHARHGNPDDRWPDPLPSEFDLDPGHHDSCAAG